MTPVEAYAEALRRIREAEETGAVELSLSGLETLNRLPPDLERLTSLQSLYLSRCWQLCGESPPSSGKDRHKFLPRSRYQGFGRGMTVGTNDHRRLLHFFGPGCFDNIYDIKTAQCCVTIFPGNPRTFPLN